MKRLLHYVCILATAAALTTSGAGCSKDKGPAAAEAITAESAVTEKNGDLEVTWNVTPDGQVTALVKDKDGLPVRKGVTVTVTVKPQGGGAPVAVPLTPQGDAGLLTGQIPKLDADLTEVSYDVQADAAKSQGTMHLPRGGTKELVESAREAAAAKPIAKDQKGPNGGVVQVVGDDIVEVVADKGSGAVRVYFLDDDLKVIPIGKRKGKLGFVGASPVVVDVTPDPGGLYLVGKVDISIQPVKITVVVIDGDEVDVALCGYVPGGVIVVGPAAPVIGVFIVTSWPVVVVPGVVVVQPGVIVQPGVVVVTGKGKGKGKWKWKGKKW
jgi:hypothetical protein